MSRNVRDGDGLINASDGRVARAEDVRRALDLVRPGLVADGGNAELLALSDDGDAHIEFQGACARCPARDMTRKFVLEPALRARVPGVRSVFVT